MRFPFPLEKTMKVDKNIKKVFRIQDIGHQATKDSDPWKMGHSTNVPGLIALREVPGHNNEVGGQSLADPLSWICGNENMKRPKQLGLTGQTPKRTGVQREL